MSQPRTSGASRAGARPRGLLDSLLCRQLGNVHGAPLPNSSSLARNSLTPPLFAAVSPRALLEDLTCDSARDVHGFASGGRGVPPFSVRYCPDAGRGHVLAVADESGLVSMIDTRHGVAEQRADDGFPAHHNALFDLAWVAGERRLVTGSGDQTCKLFDVETKLELSSYHAHRGSVKSVSVRPGAPHLFASGARDGDIHVWDARAGTAPVVTVLNAHYSPDAAGGKRNKKKPSIGRTVDKTLQGQNSIGILKLNRHFKRLFNRVLNGGSIQLKTKNSIENSTVYPCSLWARLCLFSSVHCEEMLGQ